MDLTKASDILRELEKRNAARNLERYRPSRVQEAMHKSGAHVRLMVAANGTGKTTAAVAEAIAYAKGFRPWDGSRTPFLPPVRVLLTCNDFAHASYSDLMPIVNAFFPECDYGKPPGRLANGKVHLLTHRNGSEVHIQSYEQAIRAFEGAPWHLAVFNEPPPRQIWVAVKRGLAKRDGYAVFAMTPVGPDAAWVRHELFTRAGDDPDIAAFTATLDESFMSHAARARFVQGLTEAEKAARVYGEFSSSVGRVYLDFSNEVNVITDPLFQANVKDMIADPSVPKGMVVDPHDRKPFAMGWFMITPQGDHVWYDEWPNTLFQDERSTKLAVQNYADIIREKERGMKSVVWRLLDPNYGIKANALTQETFQEKFGQYGLYFDCRIKDSLHEGHDAVRDLLVYDHSRPVEVGNRPKLYIMPGCTNLINAMNFYAWAEGTGDGLVVKEKVDETYKDHADLVRYAAISRLCYFNPVGRRVRTAWTRLTQRGTL